MVLMFSMVREKRDKNPIWDFECDVKHSSIAFNVSVVAT